MFPNPEIFPLGRASYEYNSGAHGQRGKPQTFSIHQRPSFRNGTAQHASALRVPADFFAGKTTALQYMQSAHTSAWYSDALCVAQLGLQVGRQKAGKERFAAHRMLVMRRLISQRSHEWPGKKRAIP